MEDFNNLNQLYEYIDNAEFADGLVEIFCKLRDKINEDSLEDAKKAQWEIDFFSFTIIDNKLHSPMSRTDKDGILHEFPSLKNFSKEQFEYLKQRMEQTSNPILKARYSHLLWTSKKHNDYAKVAIDGYLDSANTYEKNTERRGVAFNILNIIKNVYRISSSTKYKLANVKAEILRVANNFSPNHHSSFTIKNGLIPLMLEDKSLFKKEDFIGLEKSCEDLANELSEHARIDMLSLGEMVDVKLGNTDSKWKLAIAKEYEELSKSRKDDTNMIKIEYCQKAIEIYKQLKNEEKVKELMVKLKGLRNNLKLGSIPFDFNVTDLMESFRASAEELSEKDSETIIKTLMLDPSIIPKVDDLKLTKDANYALMFLGQTTIFDKAHNTAKHYDSDDQSESQALIWNFNTSLFFRNLLIRELLITLIRKRKLTAAILINYFNKHSWFGKNIKKAGQEEYNWLNLISPGIIEYFSQIEFALSIPGYKPNFVLAIDSLTLKIEGLLRDLCDIHGGVTFNTKTEGEHIISREKDITALLRDETIKILLDKDDLFFLEYVLIAQDGCNLRHKVSHCLMSYDDYTMQYVHLLILAILKLGKRDFKDEFLKE